MINNGRSGEKQDRYAYLDNLRVFLVALVICHHQAIAFGAPGGWYYIVERSPDVLSLVALTLFVGVNQSFFMSLLFFIAGYFTPLSLDRKGAARFVCDRLVRLVIPLLTYFFVLNPSIIYLTLRFQDTVSPGYFSFMATQAVEHFRFGPLWFVLLLLVFTGIYLGNTTVAGRYAARPLILQYPGKKQILVFIVAIGCATFLLRVFVPLGTTLLGIEVAYTPLYIALFFFGIHAYRGKWLKRLDTSHATPWFRLALALIVALPAILVLGGALRGQEDAFRGGLTGQSLAYALWEPFLCIGISMKLLVCFRKRMNWISPLTAHLSQSAYAAYIIHPVFVIIATHIARNWPLPALVTTVLLCPLSLASTFATAALLRRIPLLKKVL